MGFLKNLRNRRREDAAKRIEAKAIELYQKHAGKSGDFEDMMYSDLYDELKNKAGLDIATVISLIQIALFIWQWFKSRDVKPEQAAMVDIPSFDFQTDHEDALGRYGSFLGLAS